MKWLKNITHLTFDCYGTLIDWEHGILDAVQPLLARHGVNVPPKDILRNYVEHEAEIESHGWQPYREVLRWVLTGMAADFGVRLPLAEHRTLADSLPHWAAFPDTVTALQQLSARFKLVILSNTDDALFVETAKTLQVKFAAIITAEQVKSYKPGVAHFCEALSRLNLRPSDILHVAQSIYHDHIPARQLGFRTAWVNRASLLPDVGLAPKVSVQTDIVVPDLQTLVKQLTVGMRTS